jgi:hypothetical protein
MLTKIINYLFWSKSFEEIREKHKKMCYELGKYDQEREFCYTHIDERYEQ